MARSWSTRTRAIASRIRNARGHCALDVNGTLVRKSFGLRRGVHDQLRVAKWRTAPRLRIRTCAAAVVLRFAWRRGGGLVRRRRRVLRGARPEADLRIHLRTGLLGGLCCRERSRQDLHYAHRRAGSVGIVMCTRSVGLRKKQGFSTSTCIWRDKMMAIAPAVERRWRASAWRRDAGATECSAVGGA